MAARPESTESTAEFSVERTPALRSMTIVGPADSKPLINQIHSSYTAATSSSFCRERKRAGGRESLAICLAPEVRAAALSTRSERLTADKRREQAQTGGRLIHRHEMAGVVDFDVRQPCSGLEAADDLACSALPRLPFRRLERHLPGPFHRVCPSFYAKVIAKNVVHARVKQHGHLGRDRHRQQLGKAAQPIHDQILLDLRTTGLPSNCRLRSNGLLDRREIEPGRRQREVVADRLNGARLLVVVNIDGTAHFELRCLDNGLKREGASL